MNRSRRDEGLPQLVIGYLEEVAAMEPPVGLLESAVSDIDRAGAVGLQRSRPVLTMPAWVAVGVVIALVAGVAALYAIGSTGNIGDGQSPAPAVNPTTAPTPQATWTGPVRTDSQGDAVELSEYVGLPGPEDPLDAALGWADIVDVNFSRHGQAQWYIQLAEMPPVETEGDPAETVVEYGLVIESTGDGIADYVVGISTDTVASGGFRVWVTNIATGRTDEQVGPPYGYPVEFAHPLEEQTPMPGGPTPPYMMFTFLPGSHPLGALGRTDRFYAWASVIEDGEVVAWDYAPDAAWVGREPAEATPSAADR